MKKQSRYGRASLVSWWVLPFDPTDSVRMSDGAAGTRMLVRVSQEAIHLTFKGVGLAVPAFMSAAKTLLDSTRFMLPRSHFMHPPIVSLLRLSESMAAVAGTNPLQTINSMIRAAPSLYIAIIVCFLGAVIYR